MGKMKENFTVYKEDYDLLAWENGNFTQYLENVLGATTDQIQQIANGWIKEKE